MITNKEVALKILQVGKAGFDTQEDGYKKLDECMELIDKHIAEQLILLGVSQQSELLKEIFNITAGAWDDPVISEDLYNRMEAAISFNCG